MIEIQMSGIQQVFGGGAGWSVGAPTAERISVVTAKIRAAADKMLKNRCLPTVIGKGWEGEVVYGIAHPYTISWRAGSIAELRDFDLDAWVDALDLGLGSR